LVIGDLEAVAGLIAAEEFGSRATAVAGPAIGQSAVIREGTLIAGGLPSEILSDVLSDAAALLDRERSVTLTYGTNEVYIESLVPRPHLVVFGAVHIAQELVPMAKRLGFHVVVSDARAAFTTPERFPDADSLLIGWPDQIELVFDRRTYVVVLSHDARFEDPLWPLVLKAPVAYIGAMHDVDARSCSPKASTWHGSSESTARSGSRSEPRLPLRWRLPSSPRSWKPERGPQNRWNSGERSRGSEWRV
jgi:xanthine dehydrogenase accessory factor